MAHEDANHFVPFGAAVRRRHCCRPLRTWLRRLWPKVFASSLVIMRRGWARGGMSIPRGASIIRETAGNASPGYKCRTAAFRPKAEDSIMKRSSMFALLLRLVGFFGCGQPTKPAPPKTNAAATDGTPLGTQTAIEREGRRSGPSGCHSYLQLQGDSDGDRRQGETHMAPIGLPPGTYGGCDQQMVIGHDGVVSYKDNLHLAQVRIAPDGSLDATFPAEAG